MLTPEFLRLLSLAQLVTPEVVRLGQEGDIKAAVVRSCNGTLAHTGVPPVPPEEAQDVAEIVGSMLAARFWANRAEATARYSDAAERFIAAAISAPVHPIPAAHGA